MIVKFHFIINFILLVGKKKSAAPPVHPDTVKTATKDSVLTVVDFVSQQSTTTYIIVFCILLLIAAIMYLPRVLDQRKINRLLKSILAITGIGVIVFILTVLPKNLLLIVCSAGILIIVISLFDLMRNLVARCIIGIRSPFKKGDIITVDGIKGKIKAINPCLTYLQTINDSLITVPNSRFIRTGIENHSNGNMHFQVPVELYLPLETDLIKTRDIALKAVKISRYINLDHPLDVTIKNVMQSGRSLVCLTIFANINDPEFESPFRSEVTESIIHELKKNQLLKAIQPTQP